MIQSGRFDLCQLQYNLIQQGATAHALPAAGGRGMGITVMRPLAAGAFAQIVRTLAPGWETADDANAIALRFLLSDRRIHTINTGMRWRHEVEANVRLVDGFEPTCDLADLPRSVGQRYRRAST